MVRTWLGMLVLVLILVGAGAAMAAPHPEDYGENGHQHGHQHGHEHATPQAPGKSSHDDDPEDLETHLPIQVYYALEHRGQPWRPQLRETTYREMRRQGVVVLVLQGLVLGWLWRRRRS